MSFLISQNNANLKNFFLQVISSNIKTSFLKNGNMYVVLFSNNFFFGFSHILIQNNPMWRRWSTAAAPIFHSTTKYIVTLFTAVAFCSYDCYGMRSVFLLGKTMQSPLEIYFLVEIIAKNLYAGFFVISGSFFPTQMLKNCRCFF